MISKVDIRSVARFRLLVGIGIKTIGYMVIAAGIFLSIKDKVLAYKIVIFGVLMVLSGWGLIVQALKTSSRIRIL